MDIDSFLLETNFDEAAQAAQKNALANDEVTKAAAEGDEGGCDGCTI